MVFVTMIDEFLINTRDLLPEQHFHSTDTHWGSEKDVSKKANYSDSLRINTFRDTGINC